METEVQLVRNESPEPPRNNVTELQLGEAVMLGSALVSHICDTHSLRALIIKGPGASFLGARPIRPSSDIDVLVHPLSFKQLFDALNRYGWIARPFAENVGIPNHSVTLYHEEWPVDIDLHRYYPGFGTSADQAFELLSENSTECEFAGVNGRIPDKAAASIIQSLHALRNASDTQNCGHATEDLEWIGQNPDRCSGTVLRQLAEKLDATGPLEPYFRRFYPLEASTMEFSVPSDEWTRRTELTAPGSLRISALLDAHGRNRVRILWASLFRVGDSLGMKDLRLKDAGVKSKSKANLQRILNFVGQIPMAIHQVRRYRSLRNDNDR